MEARELANKLYGRAYGDSFDDVLWPLSARLTISAGSVPVSSSSFLVLFATPFHQSWGACS